MADEDRYVKVRIESQADNAGFDSSGQALDKLKAKAEETASAVGKAGKSQAGGDDGAGTEAAVGMIIGRLTTAVAIGLYLKSQIDQVTEAINQEIEASEELNKQLTRRIKSYGDIESFAASQRATQQLQEEIDLLEKRRAAAYVVGPQRDLIDNQIGLLRQEQGILSSLAEQGIRRAEHERDTRYELEAQLNLLQQQERSYANVRADAEARVRAENQLGRAEANQKIAQVEADRAAGKLSDPEAIAKTAEIQRKQEIDEFERAQKARTEALESFREQSEAAAASRAEQEQKLADLRDQQAADRKIVARATRQGAQEDIQALPDTSDQEEGLRAAGGHADELADRLRDEREAVAADNQRRREAKVDAEAAEKRIKDRQAEIDRQQKLTDAAVKIDITTKTDAPRNIEKLTREGEQAQKMHDAELARISQRESAERAAADRKAQKDQEEHERRKARADQAQREYQEETAIRAARAAGDDELADRLESERTLRSDIARLTATDVDREDAKADAIERQNIALDDQAKKKSAAEVDERVKQLAMSPEQRRSASAADRKAGRLGETAKAQLRDEEDRVARGAYTKHPDASADKPHDWSAFEAAFPPTLTGAISGAITPSVDEAQPKAAEDGGLSSAAEALSTAAEKLSAAAEKMPGDAQGGAEDLKGVLQDLASEVRDFKNAWR